jgi:hypothetical protein
MGFSHQVCCGLKIPYSWDSWLKLRFRGHVFFIERRDGDVLHFIVVFVERLISPFLQSKINRSSLVDTVTA